MRSPRRSRTRKEAEAAGFRSGFEFVVAEALTRVEAEFEYEPFALEYEVHEKKKYTPDFVLDNGIIVECKGRLTAADRKKMLLVKKAHPDRDIRLLFQFDNKLNPRSKTRYSTWAEKNGFRWALKEVPEAWLLET